MKYDPKTHNITLASGREFYAFGGVLGLGGRDNAFHDKLYYGWDGDVWPVPDWTPEERREIADAMIARWQAFALPEESMRGPNGECPHCGKIDCRCHQDVGGNTV